MVVALLGLVVVRSARSWVASPVLRWSLGVMVVVAPVMFSELNATITNVGWPYLIAGFWAIASREEGRFDTPLRAVTVLLGALSTLIQIVLLPWAIIMAVHRRRRSTSSCSPRWSSVWAVQGLAVMASEPQDADTTRNVGDLFRLLGVRVFGSFVAGERWISSLSTTAIIDVGVGSIASSWSSSSSPGPAASTGIGGSSSAPPSSPASVRSCDRLVPRHVHRRPLGARGLGLGGGRYGYLPVLLIFSALVVMVDQSGRRWLQAVLMAQTAFVIATSLTLAGPARPARRGRRRSARRRPPAGPIPGST